MSEEAAVPLRTLVPMNTQLLRSVSPAAAATAPGIFSTGNVSPVSTAWLTKKSFACSTTASAGTRLPAASRTTSPGTTSAEGSVSSTPSRTTIDLIVTCERNCSIAWLAMYSCRKPRMVLPKTTASTTPASTHSAATSETSEAPIRISTSGLLNCLA